MSTAVRRRFQWPVVSKLIQNLSSLLIVFAIAAVGFMGGHMLVPESEHAVAEPVSSENAIASQSIDVALTPEKFAAAEIETGPAQLEEFQVHRTVPGTIAYDATRKVELRATVDCVVTQTLVQPSQVVEPGQAIMILSGPAVSAARNEVRQSESALALVEKEFQWTQDTHTNTQALLKLLDQSKTVEEISAQFANKNLGEHRDDILTAYSQFVLAKNLEERTSQLDDQGVIPAKTVAERHSQFEIASARFNSVREELKFQMQQGLIQANAKLEVEQQRLDVAREKLSSLLGPHANQKPDATVAGISEFVLNAPRAGQIINLPAVESARFAPGDVLVEIADNEVVWVEAQISQRDWHTLTLARDQSLNIRVAAIPNQMFQATVRYIGTAVSKITMAIPLTAELNNSDLLFWPGMSVWVDIPTSAPRSAIVVPVSAVQQNEMASFVFVQTGERMFQRRDVRVGAESDGRAEIISGLAAGEPVVTQGAFYLKSELLLAAEE